MESLRERELITVGFGNYSTLVAAQWANSTSRYDVHHSTLYRERHASHILGGGDDGTFNAGAAFSSGGRANSIVRVPRLLLLDAPHASDYKDLAEVEEEMKLQAAAADAAAHEDEEAEKRREDQARQSACFADPTSSAMLWQQTSPPLAAEERRWHEAATFARQHYNQQRYRPQRRSCIDDDDDNDNEGSEEPSDDEAEEQEDYYYQLQRPRDGIEVEPAYKPTPTSTAPTGEEEEEARRVNPTEGDKRHSKAFYKRKLFRRKDGTVTWWRYITTGLDADSVTTLRPPHHIDASGELPTLHNFGYGQSTFKAGNSAVGSADEAENFANALRRQLEDTDALQGLQCFIDGDSMFAGAAYNVLTEFWEDVGPKTPVAAFTVFTPLPPALVGAEAPFAQRRRDEVALNRLLCTSLLSEPAAAVYIPLEVGDWSRLMSSRAGSPCWWLDDDTATAQFIATIADSALYGARDGASAGGGPAFYMPYWARTVRPTPSLRVSALLGALPMAVPTPALARTQEEADLWNFLSRTPLLPDALEAVEDAALRPTSRFVPLTHSFTQSPLSEAGRVVSHTVCLRGAGVLPSTRYPPHEAMQRYGCQWSGSYLPLLTSTNVPVSTTFPLSLLFDSSKAMHAFEGQCGTAGISTRDAFSAHGVDVGAHVVTSYQSAPMLNDTVVAAKSALRYKEHLHNASYGLDRDDWNERLEDVASMFDDYRHGHGTADNDQNSSDDGDW